MMSTDRDSPTSTLISRLSSRPKSAHSLLSLRDLSLASSIPKGWKRSALAFFMVQCLLTIYGMKFPALHQNRALIASLWCISLAGTTISFFSGSIGMPTISSTHWGRGFLRVASRPMF
uniref:Uncharacterized protein n=1 Tax=Opuntia streptacantha TaxID=393608 RepID=A0A7C9EBW5_OPUST